MTVPPSSSRPFPRSQLLRIHQQRRSIRRQEEMNGIAMLSRRCKGGGSVSLVWFIFASVRFWAGEILGIAISISFTPPTPLCGFDARCGVLIV